MDVRKTELASGDVTVIEVLREGLEPWSFAPFEDQRAHIHVIDDRFIVALGSPRPRRTPRVGVFDAHLQSTVAMIRSPGLNHLRGFACSTAHRAVFFPDSSGAPHPQAPGFPALDGIRRIDLDSGESRFILVGRDFHVSEVIARADGAIVCIGAGKQVALLDPGTGMIERSEAAGAVQTFQGDYKLMRLGWFSPDGAWALSAHLGSVVTHDPSLLSRWLPGRAETAHPDLVGAKKGRLYGVSLDLYQLAPLRNERRLILRYLPAPSAELGETLDHLAARQDWRFWDGRSQMFFTKSMTAEEARAYYPKKPPEQEAAAFLTGVEAIEWDGDSGGFVVTFMDGLRRHSTLDGQVGPLLPAIPKPKYVMGSIRLPPSPSEKAVERIRRDLVDRATVRVVLRDYSASGFAQAIGDMADRMEAGLANLVFNDALQFVVLDGRKRLREKRFFKLVRDQPDDTSSAIIQPLRRLMESYGKQAVQRDSSLPLVSDFSEESAPAALSHAALALAELDPLSFEVLRPWFESVDQEHDHFAAEKVLPAVMKRAGFSSRASNRFGLWFLMHQWQTASYDPFALGIIEAARELFDPAAFAAAIVEEARSFTNFDGFKDSDTSPEQHRIELIAAGLEVSRPWDVAVSRELALR